MNIKQFLKPDWRKIVIFVIILLPSFIPSIIIGGCVNNLFNCQFLSGLFYNIFDRLLVVFYTLIKFPLFLILREILGIPYQIFLPTILVSFINWFWMYLLSCFIIWIYDKFKSVKVKK